METKDWLTLIASLLVPFVSMIGAFLAAIIGGSIAILGNKYLFKLNMADKYRARLVEKRIEAYEKLYRIIIKSWDLDSETFSKLTREWSSKYDLFSTTEISVLLVKLFFAFDVYKKEPNDRTRDRYGQMILDIRAEIRKQLSIELADPEYLRKLWNLDKYSNSKE